MLECLLGVDTIAVILTESTQHCVGSPPLLEVKTNMNRISWIVACCSLVACQSREQPAGYELGARQTRGSSRFLPDLDDVWDFDAPAETERAFRDLLPTAEQSRNAEYHLQLLTQIARTQGLQRDFVYAHATLDRVEEMLTDETPVAGVRYLLERGRVFNSSGSSERAEPLFLEAWETAKALRVHTYAVDAAHMLAIVDSSRALEWNLAALEYAEASNDERALAWRGSLYNNIGWTWHDAREYDKALEMFRKDFIFRVESKNDEGARIAKWSMARTLRSLGRHAEALDMQRDLALEFEQLGRVDGFVHEELGELLLAIGQQDPSKEQFGRAYDELSKDTNFVANNPVRLERMRQLGAR